MDQMTDSKVSPFTSDTTQPLGEMPVVSVVIPMLNESGFIEACVSSFDAQTYPSERLEVLIVDGGSTDGSREQVETLGLERPWLRLVDNPDRRAASAFNRGIEAATGDVICIVGAHATVGPDFIERSVRALEETGAGGVGGQLKHEGTSPQGQAIGLAMTSKFGMASPFRYATDRREVDTIGHPAYRREVLESVGPFNESLERNSDYELNHRIRAAGHTLILDPTIVTIYHPRPTLSALGRQFYDYGRGKTNVMRMMPDSIKPRHLVPPVFVLGLIAAPVLLKWRWSRRLLGLGATTYSVAIVAELLRTQPWNHGAHTPTYVAAFPVMHVTWGLGILRELLRPSK